MTQMASIEPEKTQRMLEARLKAEEAERRRRDATAAELMTNLQEARVAAEEAAVRVQGAADAIRTFCRRGQQETDAAYLVLANAHLRFAGAVVQGVKRAATMDRLVKNAQREQEEARLRAAEQKRQQEARARSRAYQKLELPTDSDLEDLYGEVVTNASE